MTDPKLFLPSAKALLAPFPPELAYNALVERVSSIQTSLDDKQEIGVVANGAGLLIHVEKVERDGQLIVFSGEDPNGQRSWLVQHYTQLNVQIVAVPKTKPAARRIGF